MSLLFSKTVFFLKIFVSLSLFWLIQSIFRSIKIVLKLFKEASVCFDWSKLIFDQSKLFWNFLKKPLSVSINKKSWIRFFKNSDLTCSNYFFKTFSNFPLSLRLGKAPLIFFVVFTHFFARFSSPKAGKAFIPFLLHLFSCFYA